MFWIWVIGTVEGDFARGRLDDALLTWAGGETDFLKLRLIFWGIVWTTGALTFTLVDNGLCWITGGEVITVGGIIVGRAV